MDNKENSLKELDDLLKLDRPDIKGELAENVKRYRQLTDCEDEDFKHSKILERVMNFIDSQYGDKEPPVKLVKDILTAYEKRKTRINQNIIDTMLEYGQTSAKFDDGTEIDIEEKISAKVYDVDKFYDWVIANGYTDAIKHTVIFKKGDYNDEVREAIDSTGTVPKVKYGIAPQTRDKIIRDVIRDNKQIIEEGGKPKIELPPDNVLSVSIFSVAKIGHKNAPNTKPNEEVFF